MAASVWQCSLNAKACTLYYHYIDETTGNVAAADKLKMCVKKKKTCYTDKRKQNSLISDKKKNISKISFEKTHGFS